MATKNLARTAIEGGRCLGYQVEIASRAAGERAEARQWLLRVARDADEAEDRVDPRRLPVRACFSDKLAPVYRYLDANCGRPWTKVREELFGRFDIRTTPGRHILFDHVLPEVEPSGRRWRPRYRIDHHGMLRKVPRERYPKNEWFDERPALRWLGDRRITRSGDRLMWWEPAKRIQRRQDGQIVTRWRAVGLLDEKDEAFVRSLPEKTREKIVR